MEELSIEEKAKGYDDALERAKSAIKECGNNLGRIKMIESIFPELKESEDEQHRKWILEYLHDGLRKSDEQFKDHFITAIAWIEKQGKSSDQIHYWTEEEIEPIINDYLRGAEHYGGMIGRLRCLKPKFLEKQNEKPATINVNKMVEEFEDFKVMAGRIPSLAEIDAYRKGVNDVLSKVLIKEEKPITIGSKKAEGKLGEMIAASKKPAGSGDEDKQLTHKEVTRKSEQDIWSEEDENEVAILEGYIASGEWSEAHIDRALGIVEELSNKLKSIKDRVQPQPKQVGWSEEDEENYRNATTIISRQKLNAYTIEMMNDCSRCIDWLSSIKERMN